MFDKTAYIYYNVLRCDNMLLDVKPIAHKPGGVLPFSLALDLSDLAFFGSFPLTALVVVQGQVSNRADVLWLEGEAETMLSLTCDRCSEAYEQPWTAHVAFMLAEELQEDEQDDILLLSDGKIDLGELFREELILGMPAKNLCEENCAGLCDGCGVNLNVESCTCGREIDPRLADLAKFFDK